MDTYKLDTWSGMFNLAQSLIQLNRWNIIHASMNSQGYMHSFRMERSDLGHFLILALNRAEELSLI